MQTLPVNYAGVLLIILAMIFFIMEMKLTSYGLLSVAGIISLLMGSLMLFDTLGRPCGFPGRSFFPPWPYFDVFRCGCRFGFPRPETPTRTGAEGLIGEIGVVCPND